MPRKSSAVEPITATVATVSTPAVSVEPRVGIAYPAFLSQFRRHFPNLSVLKSPNEVKDYDLIIFSGGEDLDPKLYGESNTMSFDPNEARDTIEMAIAKECDRLSIPMYGSCRGLQLINVMKGGTLHQDIGLAGIRHGAMHPISWEAESSKLKPLFTNVNSLHHQGIRNLGKELYIYASHSSIPEIIYGKTVLATQFHPEMMSGMEPFFKHLSDWAVHMKDKREHPQAPAATKVEA